jgi:Flp pilus assembly protein TadD
MHPHRTLWKSLLVLSTFLALAPPLLAAGSKPKASDEEIIDKLFKLGRAAVEANDYAHALEIFEKAHEAAPENPDVLNMLAYSQRKNGHLDQAIETYHAALKLRPDFPEAREYLGEAYVQAALREIETLKSYGEAGKEEREDLEEALKEAAASLE